MTTPNAVYRLASAIDNNDPEDRPTYGEWERAEDSLYAPPRLLEPAPDTEETK